MNHDYAHCFDYKKEICPKECFRAELVEDLINLRNQGKVDFLVTWANFKGTQYCEMGEKNGEVN